MIQSSFDQIHHYRNYVCEQRDSQFILILTIKLLAARLQKVRTGRISNELQSASSFTILVQFNRAGGSIDYRCEDNRFLVSARCVTISNPDPLSSTRTGFNHGIRSRKLRI
jgi:hypothetical protein